MSTYRFIVLLVTMVSIDHAIADAPLLMKDISASQLYTDKEIQQQTAIADANQKSQLTILQQEFLTFKNINQLDIKKLTKQDFALLDSAIQYQSKAFKKHTEGPLPIAIFDIASAAKFKLKQHHVWLKSQTLENLYRSDWSGFKKRFLESEDVLSVSEQAAKLELVKKLTTKETLFLAEQLMNSRSFQDPLLIEVILQSKNIDYLGLLLNKLQTPIAHQIIKENISQLEKSKQAELLKSVIESNQYLASQALNQYAKLPNGYRSKSWLASKLKDKHLGASVAMAIAQSNDPLRYEELSAIVTNQKSKRVEVANALLALRFAKNEVADEHLKKLVEGKYIRFDDMQQEAQRWLK
ncbi:hypothetical protein [Kangiella sp. HZ709]|uniref:hypothetical protein n=1 Tax=Kangiella sp. HZ709 TaxID=2666328 RepID=UPI0012AF60C2|nr:hypothetical protein [Kangiella sp. HZ709]MRX28734.1 hypothetical protein [Kangiella sp. HZ709]